MLDSDLADFYQVSTRNLNLAVKRNLARFPADFMFQMTKEEGSSLLLQSARAERAAEAGGLRPTPLQNSGSVDAPAATKQSIFCSQLVNRRSNGV